MKIGIIGAGNIGGAVGRLWAQAGHQVFFSSRRPDTLRDLAAQAGGAAVGTPDEAARFGEVVFEAVPFGKLAELPADALAGKVVLSASNYYPQRDGQMDLGGRTQSEYAASLLPGARLVKAYNMMQAGVMQALADGTGTSGLAIFYAGDDADARQVAAGLIADSRFTPVEVGTLRDGALFQTDGPLYDTQFTPDEARAALEAARAGR